MRDLRVQHGSWQFRFRERAQGAARAIVAVDYGDAVALQRQFKRSRKPGGPGSDHDSRLAGWWFANGQMGRGEGQVGIRREPFQFADSGRAVRRAPAAALFARVMAEPSQHGGQRKRPADGRRRRVGFTLLDLQEQRGDRELQRAEPLARGEAVAQVVAEKKLQRRAARRVHLFRLALHHHAGLRQRRARGDEFSIQLDQAHEARSQRPALFQMAKRRDLDPELARAVQHGLARLECHFLPVDGEGGGVFHCTSMAL